MKFKEFMNENIFAEYSKSEIQAHCNSIVGMYESGDSASGVTWETINNNTVGSFTVTIGNNVAEYKIVISKYTKTKCDSLEIYEFKFFDENYDIKLSNNMTYHLGVGPTIIKEFKKFVSTNPDVAVFSADKHEKTREKTYDKYTAKIADEFNYVPFYKTAFTTEYHEYALVRQDCVEKFKICFKTIQPK